MLRTLLDARTLVATFVAAVVGVCGLQAFPVARDNLFLAVIDARRPDIALGLAYGYGLLWFSTPFWIVSIAMSSLAIVASGLKPSWAYRPLPPYPEPETRPEPFLVLGEAHFTDRAGRAPEPRWLTIPQRGLYTGVMVLGAVGTGKTSACMYPYVDQLLRWRAADTDRKVGALVMEVKGDFCHQVKTILERSGRADDYIEIGLDTGVSYNPLHNDLDPYAVAYAIATLLNNLFGKSKEPFWQQAYTDLVKFVKASDRGPRPLVSEGVEPSRQPPSLEHHRGHRRVPLAVRRQPCCPPCVLSSTAVLHEHAGARRPASS